MSRGAALLLVLAALAGCAGPPPDPAPATIVFKHAKILGPLDPIPGLLREFERRHPGVTVRSEPLTWTSDEQHQFFVINLDGGSPAFDVLLLDVIWVPEFAQAGWLLDLSPWVTREELAPHFPAAVAAATWGGRVWGLPWNMNVGVLYYRSDLLARRGLGPPRTWEELVEQVALIRAAERDPKLDGVLWQGKQYEGLVVNTLEHFWGEGTTLLGDDDRVLPDPGRATAALAFMRGLIDRGVSPGWVTAGDEELTRRPFGDGRAIFVRSWPYALDLFEAPGSPVRGKVGIAALPGHPGGAAGIGATGGFHLAVNRRTRHPDAAVALVRFLAGEHAQRALTAPGVALYPTREALYQDADAVRAHPGMPRFHDLALAAHPRPVTPYYLMMSTAVQPEFSAALVGVKRPERAIADAGRSLRHMLENLR
ncbi:MAG TPA: ABC transporter substrate-binding protein [Methylomirabilota bacterium]|nr:ABC transporter substrate-binding protein [Methylomirabilota bacterium]